MKLAFLPQDVLCGIKNLNINFLTEIRLRRGQPVMVEYGGKYCCLGRSGITAVKNSAIICGGVAETLNKAMDGCVYSYAEELKEGFITVEGGVRIGVAGEYVTESGRIKTISRPTSLNIRIPHVAFGCSQYVYEMLFKKSLTSALLFSRPGCGKTTMLRDLAANISRGHGANVLILDVRNEIAGATDEFYDIGDTVDVVRSCDKLSSLQSAVRAMKPDIVITDELYGKDDAAAVKFARDCGINVIASSHVCDRLALEKLPFDYYVKLNGINLQPEIYDKDFDIVSDNSADDVCGSTAFGGKKEEGDCVFPALRI